MNKKLPVAILGPGNIGSDLMYKVMRSPKLDLRMLAGIIPTSEGLKRARQEGIPATDKGIDPILEDKDIGLVFDCTGVKPHLVHAPLLKQAGKIAIDLTPAAVGPYVVPSVNMDTNLDSDNINMVTCGGQATIPIVAAVNRAQSVSYAEIVATISSKSAGPGTRQNIDEFTKTTAKGVEKVGGAHKGKAIIILNPAEPPIMMRDTIYCELDETGDTEAIARSVDKMVAEVQTYVPGYRLKMPPLVEDKKVTVMVEVEGAGDFLPKYSGNLDIMNAAAVGIAERMADYRTGGKGEADHG
ncbi:MAG: acetaldehyde dehydrogenase (acetylating) [Desulfobacterales bacterium]|nr:acetaldehyde dehydrogenase (acetylating) [Desulfobacterales bacterium]